VNKQLRVIAWFEEVGRDDVPLAGGKGANLGELTRAQIPVPPGFIVTSEVYFHFLAERKLGGKIQKFLESLDPQDGEGLAKTALRIKQLISTATMPPEVAEQIKQAYRKLDGGLVAVRSSATAEDLPEASFAGQQRTFLNVQGEDEVVAAVKGCWASLFEPRAIFYRALYGFDHLKVGIAVPVQKMVQSDVSGVIFTIEPMTNDTSKIVIEAAYGLGEAVVSGEITPDLYLINKDELIILEKRIVKQEWQIVRNVASRGGEQTNVRVPVPTFAKTEQKITDVDIIALANLAKTIEDLYQFPQDIEWAKERGRFYVVQTRPVTTLKTTEMVEAVVKGEVILSGLAASPGMAAGPVKIVYQAAEIDKVKDGDVLVAEMTTPDFVPAMKRAAAIVTNRGGRTCHAAIVSRELGIPCIVGTGESITILKEEQEITVDGSTGKVYKGKVLKEKIEVPSYTKQRLRTKTKVYVNLAEPELAAAVAARDVDGVGLLRSEFMVAHIGEHPRYMLEKGRGGVFVDKLARGLVTFTSAFAPRPVVYRTTDFKTNEYRNLKGGERYEEIEENPMLGYRGCSRYVKEPDAFGLEIKAIKKVRENFANLWVMIPFVHTVKEMVEVKAVLESEGLVSSADFKLWMMAEVPSNIILRDKFIDVGIDGISIGSNDLTQLILGIDRDNPKLAEEFDERDEAVLWALEQIIGTARERGITSSICGQAPSVYPELTDKLVGWGITSVSVSPDMIERTREIIAKAEEKLAIHTSAF